MKKVNVGMSADLLHPRHINVILKTDTFIMSELNQLLGCLTP